MRILLFVVCSVFYLDTVSGIVSTFCDRSFIGRLQSGIFTSPNYPLNYTASTRPCRYRFYGPISMETHASAGGGPPRGRLQHIHNFALDGAHSRVPFDIDGAAVEEGRHVVCFVFHRFRLNSFPGNCSSEDDYLMFPGNHRYCGRGWLDVRDHVITSRPLHVWEENFCWPLEGDFMEVTFNSAIRNGPSFVTETGFYANFTVTTVPASNKITPVLGDDKSVSKAPCSDDQFTCFNRACISTLMLCNGRWDCADGSDEQYAHARCPGRQDIHGCDFEPTGGVIIEMCRFRGVNWSRLRYSPFGPRYDHTIGQLNGPGYFVFTVLSFPKLRFEYQETIQPPSRSTPRCFRFWYFMSGSGVGSLHVFVNTTAQLVSQSGPAWSRESSQGPQWLQGEVGLPSYVTQITTLYFEVVRGYSTDVNIALDDISLDNEDCFGEDISCTFELGQCGWKSDNASFANWLRHSGPTSSSDTGPSNDSRGDPDGYYMYLEASNPRSSVIARIVSRPVSASLTNTWCLTYYYHLYGRDTGILRVKLLHPNRSEDMLAGDMGDRGDVWRRKTVPIAMKGPFQIIFEAEKVDGVRSDIAIDDIVLRPNSQSCYPEPPSTTPRTTLSQVTCSPGYFQCGDGVCIENYKLCDGRFDCQDKSDEAICPTNELSIGAIIGIALGVLFIVFALITNVIACRRRQACLRTRAPSGEVYNPDSSLTMDEDSSYSMTPFSYGEPPPAYSDNPLAPSVNYPVPTLTISLSWEPPPAYHAIISVPFQRDDGRYPPQYSPWEPPPPFEGAALSESSSVARSEDMLSLTSDAESSNVSDRSTAARRISLAGTPATGMELNKLFTTSATLEPVPLYQVGRGDRLGDPPGFSGRGQRTLQPELLLSVSPQEDILARPTGADVQSVPRRPLSLTGIPATGIELNTLFRPTTITLSEPHGRTRSRLLRSSRHGGGGGRRRRIEIEASPADLPTPAEARADRQRGSRQDREVFKRPDGQPRQRRRSSAGGERSSMGNSPLESRSTEA